MGVDYSAVALIGVRVDLDNLMPKKKVKAFPHDYPEETMFCPKTGRKLWDVERVPVDGYDEGKDLFHGFRVHAGTNWSDGTHEMFIAFESVRVKDDDGTAIRHLTGVNCISEMSKCMQSVLEPLGMWDENEFGLWVVLVCSY
jgi:hypothetical protein